MVLFTAATIVKLYLDNLAELGLWIYLAKPEGMLN